MKWKNADALKIREESLRKTLRVPKSSWVLIKSNSINWLMTFTQLRRKSKLLIDTERTLSTISGTKLTNWGTDKLQTSSLCSNHCQYWKRTWRKSTVSLMISAPNLTLSTFSATSTKIDLHSSLRTQILWLTVSARRTFMISSKQRLNWCWKRMTHLHCRHCRELSLH